MDNNSGLLMKMPNEGTDEVKYTLKLLSTDLKEVAEHDANAILGKKLSIEFLQNIHCTSCGRKTNKSFNQGYCYGCFVKLPECDMCIMKPELCSFHNGGCRDAQWGKTHCFVDHTVYLANSSGLKIGITRSHQQQTRWRDQGAVQAIPVARVKDRFSSGKAEVAFKEHVADKTNWRKMLKGEVEDIDMASMRDKFLELWPEAVEYTPAPDPEPYSFTFPVLEYPTKITSLNLDKKPLIEGTLMGIKGQYLIFDIGVINIRKFAGYEVKISY